MGPLFRRVLVFAFALACVLSPALSAQDPAAPAAPGILGTPSVIPQDGVPDILTGMATSGGIARVFSGADSTPLLAGAPFGGFTGGVRVAAGDIDGDGAADLVTAQGAGGGFVRIFNGSGVEIASGYPFGPAFTGGIYVATGDVNGDGLQDVVVATGLGGLVRVYSLAGGLTLLHSGFPYGPTFTGGVRVAAGDVNGDGRADIITAPASGAAPVKIFSGTDLALLSEGAPYGPGFTGGVFVAAGDVNGDGVADIITSPGAGPMRVRVFTGPDATPGLEFLAAPEAVTVGLSVAAADLDGDGKAEIIGGLGPGGPPLVGVFDGTTGALLSFFTAEAASFRGGVLVAAAAASGIRFTSAATTTFTTGTVGTFTITTSAVPTVTGITVAGTLPGGVTFTDHHDGTATLSGTPTPGVGGLHTLTFTATNGDDAPAMQTFTLRVEGPPQITSADATTFSVNGAGSFTVTTIGFPRPTLTATGPLPQGVTFTGHDAGTATLAGTPQTGSGGTYPLTLTATNGVGPAATQSFTLSVHQAPTITSPATATFTVGEPGTFEIVATGFPAPTLVIGGAALPDGVTFTPNADGTGTLAGTPDPGTGGDYALTIMATNSAGSSGVQSFTLSVNTPPAITSADNTTFTAGVTGSFPVTATGLPAPTIAHTGGTFPAGVTFNPVTNTIEGIATAIGSTPGLQLTATNGVSPDAMQSFTLTVICPVITVTGMPPALPNGTFNVAYPNAQFNQTGGGAGTWSASGLPPGVGIDSATGLLSGTPSNTGQFNATITFTNTAGCTGAFTDSFDIAPNVVGDSYSPGRGNTQVVVANDSSPSTPFFAFGLSLLANDEGPGLTVTTFAGTTALGGTVSINATGGFTYTPQVGDTGNDSFSYTVTSNGISATGTVTVALGTQRIWYVQQGASGDGRSQSPLGALTTLNDPGGDADIDAPGDDIYIYAGNYGGLETEASQTVWGSGAAFDRGNGLAIQAGTRPTLQGTVTIAGNNVTVSSLAISTGASTGITNSGPVSELTVKNDVTVTTTTGTAVSFTNVHSTAGGSPSFGINFRSVTTNGAARGIALLDVNALNGSFVVTGVDGSDAGGDPDPGSGGTIANASVRGVEMVNVGRVVGLGGMMFTNAGSTDGAPSTECDSYLTGDNTLCHAAIHLVNVGAGIGGQVALNNVVVIGGSQVGINGRGVTNLTMHQVEVSNVGTDSHESGVMLQNVFGTGGVTDSDFHDNSARQFHIANATGTLSSFTITGSRFANSDAPNGIQGMLVEASGTSTTMVVTAGGTGVGEGNTFENLFSNAWQVGAANDATLTVTLQHSSITNTNGIVAQASLNSQVTAVIQNNTFLAGPKTGAGVISIKTDGGGDLVGDIRGNTIGQTGVAGSGTACGGCNGMFINARDPDANMILTIVGNTIQNVNGGGIFLSGGQAATQSVDAVITGNLIREPGPTATTNGVALEVRNGVSSGPPADAGCLAATLGGTVTPPSWPSLAADAKNRILGTWNSAGGPNDFFVWRRFSTVINLPGLSGDPAAWITARNDFDGTPAVTVDPSGGSIGSAASCTP